MDVEERIIKKKKEKEKRKKKNNGEDIQVGVEKIKEEG